VIFLQDESERGEFRRPRLFAKPAARYARKSWPICRRITGLNLFAMLEFLFPYFFPAVPTSQNLADEAR